MERSEAMANANPNWLLPLWLAFPDITPEMYPRPHRWNAYCNEWQEWYSSLSPLERQSYETGFPEQRGWECFYQFVRNES